MKRLNRLVYAAAFSLVAVSAFAQDANNDDLLRPLIVRPTETTNAPQPAPVSSEPSMASAPVASQPMLTPATSTYAPPPSLPPPTLMADAGTSSDAHLTLP